jgi:hypothetical protein
MTTCFGLNGTMSLPEPLGVDVTSWDAKMPCRRYTAIPATASTTTATTTIQRWLSRRLIETRCIRDPFMSGDRRGR